MAEPVNLEFDPKTSAGPLDPAFVERTEEMIGLSFDKDWIAFLSRQNGGVPRKQYFPLGKNVKVVERFLPMVDVAVNPEAAEYDVGAVWSQIEDRLTENLVPFAAIFPGDFLLFEHQASGPPKVVWWMHERSRRRQPYTEPVADSFDDFLRMLQAE